MGELSKATRGEHMESPNGCEHKAKPAKTYQCQSAQTIRMVNWWHVISTSFPWILTTLLFVVSVQIAVEVYMNVDHIKSAFVEIRQVEPLAMDLSYKTFGAVLVALYLYQKIGSPIYLLDFSCFEPPAEWKLNHDQIMQCMKAKGTFTQESLDFMARILGNSGTGQGTAWPPDIVGLLEGKKSTQSAEMARAESETVICGCVSDVLEKTGIKAKDIDILIVNCSLFSPTPSLCAIVANKFGMRSDLLTYNLSGMGCSASLISIDLAKRLLKAHPNSTALVVSTENLTQNLYHGNKRSMLVQNTLFRCGGAAMVLSNKWGDALRARFMLLNTVLTKSISEEGYNAVFECEDEEGNHGVRLSKAIVEVAGKCMEANLTTLGPMVLPYTEQVMVALSIVAKKLRKMLPKGLQDTIGPIRTYVPDFKTGIDHFCLHAGGRRVLDGIEKNLKLTPAHLKASRQALFHYGNTSSSSIWYELRFMELNGEMKRGDRALQLAFGSGFKCNSAVWLCLRPKHKHGNPDFGDE
uniref:3-ketoacyl-CoA synthase n=1 Tax=Phaeomonas parva TaxID=124430 RepID=A0A7S1U9N3_9STRA|mmetsp:Transcript_381/g.968  ORF Transcript_381/g.968 Transcript_381/m.968 type:complete len:523 (+) Transcript_381:313-1881(+)|eukprot:CAMPEP_0118858032 /NCGR_PEP_ID=MMETSP1163-20130328/4885_1 /TAXON_ID=124430 /ORGANISM="Phaeomonas parva, Strain CCMP2877" /LENGTH=522 /DNA_ID=CAMNT_0006791435 /DNA_START=227 /DNA_END=1795 /DNA_ORIENTATION=-